MNVNKAMDYFFSNNDCIRQPLSTGWDALDEHLGGGFVEGLYTLTGEPKSGKTALALYLQLMAALGGRGEEFRFFSLELSAEHLTARILSAVSHDADGIEPFTWASYRQALSSLQDAECPERSPIVMAGDAFKEAMARSGARLFIEEPRRVPCGTLAMVDDGSWDPCTDEEWKKMYLDGYGNVRYSDVKGLPLFESDVERLLGAFAGDTYSEYDWHVVSDLTVIDYLQLVGVAELGDGADVYRKTNRVVGYLARSPRPILAISEQNRSALRASATSGARYGASGSGRIEYAASAALRLELVRDEGEAGRVVALHVDLSRYGTPTGDSPIYLRYIPQYNVFMPLDS